MNGLRCYTMGIVPLVWAALLHFGVVTDDNSRVPFLILLGLSSLMHAQRRKEKGQERLYLIHQRMRENDA